MLDTHVYLSTGRADPMQSGGFRSTKYARLETTRRLAYSLGDIVRVNREVRILSWRLLVLRPFSPQAVRERNGAPTLPSYHDKPTCPKI
jgi:hypothetical protein